MSQSCGKLVLGQYDPSQPGRLLRLPGSKLSFASFHPGTASAWRESLPDINKLSLNEELYRPKRVVIETSPDGQSSWRFVPKTRLEPGVEDEGIWPRVVDLSGELVEFDQDLWDIYKLDPEYTCIVRAFPSLTLITRNKGKTRASENISESHSSGQLPPNATGSKRRFVTLSPERQAASQTPSSKRPRYIEIIGDPESDLDSSDDGLGNSDGEEDEVEDMIIDETTPVRPNATGYIHRPRGRSKLRGEIEASRKTRREKTARRMQRNGTSWGGINRETVDLTGDDSIPVTPKPESMKRKVSSDNISGGTPNDTSNEGADRRPRSFKRARTISPTSIKRDLAGKKAAREKNRTRALLANPRYPRFEPVVDEVLADVPEEASDDAKLPADAQNAHVEPSQPDVEELDEEAVRQAAIEESRRKIAELEKDRPLWQQSVYEREEKDQKERVEKEALEKDRRRHEEAERAARERKERERMAQERREQERRAREAAARREKDERERKRRQQWDRWCRGPWTSQRALERYKILADAFDNTKFSKEEEPLTFEVIPWPVLSSPVSFTVEDIDWSAVESFFAEIRHHMRSQDYKVFVEKSHRRFHPDRWRGRRLFDAVVLEQERGELEVAANTVAQAITPIWREMKSR